MSYQLTIPQYLKLNNLKLKLKEYKSKIRNYDKKLRHYREENRKLEMQQNEIKNQNQELTEKNEHLKRLCEESPEEPPLKRRELDPVYGAYIPSNIPEFKDKILEALTINLNIIFEEILNEDLDFYQNKYGFPPIIMKPDVYKINSLSEDIGFNSCTIPYQDKVSFDNGLRHLSSRFILDYIRSEEIIRLEPIEFYSIFSVCININQSNLQKKITMSGDFYDDMIIFGERARKFEGDNHKFPEFMKNLSLFVMNFLLSARFATRRFEDRKILDFMPDTLLGSFIKNLLEYTYKFFKISDPSLSTSYVLGNLLN